MNSATIQLTAKIFMLFFLSFVIAFTFEGLTATPQEGDSVAYHIPIAQSVLTGAIFHPTFHLGYYPGIGEAILALFLFLEIPLNLYNVLAIVCLFFTAKKAGEVFQLKNNLSILFAVSITLLHVVIRWYSSQVIDIWLAIFFVTALTLLEKPSGKISYFLKLGIVLGLLIGTKYSGPIWAGVLVLMHIKKILQYITFKNTVALLFPVFFLGFSWYIRNYLLTGNPVYPQNFFIFPGADNWNIFQFQMWQAVLYQPVKVMNAFVAEYMGWGILALCIIPYFIYKASVDVKNIPGNITLLALVGIVNLVIFLLLPTSFEYNIIVSSFRYSYPVFIPLILLSFLYAQRFKKEEILILFAAANVSLLPTTAYRPKLLLVLLTVCSIVFFHRKIRSFLIKSHDK